MTTDPTPAHTRRATAELTRSERDAVHDDLAAILRALGIGAHARPYSSHEVVQREVLPAIAALTERGCLLSPPCWDSPNRRAPASETCACGKPLAHLSADEESADWACLVPSETPGPGEGELRGERSRAFRDAEHATRRARQAWQKDGGDPCRVRVLGGVADTLAAWADGRGRPDDPAAAWRRNAAVEPRTPADPEANR